MALFNPRPSRQLALTIIAAAAVLAVFGTVTLITQGYPWFALLWLALAAVIVIFAVRRLRAPS
jgi:uncharacterized membrane protein YkvI